jgi:hypothetical protein
MKINFSDPLLVHFIFLVSSTASSFAPRRFYCPLLADNGLHQRAFIGQKRSSGANQGRGDSFM